MRAVSMAVHQATSRPTEQYMRPPHDLTGQHMRPPRDLQGSAWGQLTTYRAVHEATSRPTGQYMRPPRDLQGSAWGINSHLMAYMVEESSIHGSTWGHLASYRAVHEATSWSTGQYMRPPRGLTIYRAICWGINSHAPNDLQDNMSRNQQPCT